MQIRGDQTGVLGGRQMPVLLFSFRRRDAAFARNENLYRGHNIEFCGVISLINSDTHSAPRVDIQQ
jgi:hypothetical protein